MSQRRKKADIVNENQKKVAETEIVHSTEDTFITLVPRKNSGLHLLVRGEVIYLLITDHEYISSIKAEFQDFIKDKNLPFCELKVLEFNRFKNNRSSERKLVEYTAIIQTYAGIFSGDVIDISENGMRIETTYPIVQEGDIIEIDYTSEHGSAHVKKGKVRWCKTSEDGYFYFGIELITEFTKRKG